MNNDGTLNPHEHFADRWNREGNLRSIVLNRDTESLKMEKLTFDETYWKGRRKQSQQVRAEET